MFCFHIVFDVIGRGEFLVSHALSVSAVVNVWICISNLRLELGDEHLERWKCGVILEHMLTYLSNPSFLELQQ